MPPSNTASKLSHSDQVRQLACGPLIAGIDLGSISSKAVILSGTKIVASAIINSKDFRGAAHLLHTTLEGTGIDDDSVRLVFGTGLAECDQRIRNIVSEISCHLRGLCQHACDLPSKVLVMGGEGSAAILGEGCRVKKFVMNDCRREFCSDNYCRNHGCGDASGKVMEELAALLGVPIQDVGPRSLTVSESRLQDLLRQRLGVGLDRPVMPLSWAITSVCPKMAESKVQVLLADGWSKAEILAAYSASMVSHAILLLKRLDGLPEGLAVTGGVANNSGFVRRLEKELALKVVTPNVDPQLTAALGASLFARDFLRKRGLGYIA